MYRQALILIIEVIGDVGSLAIADVDGGIVGVVVINMSAS